MNEQLTYLIQSLDHNEYSYESDDSYESQDSSPLGPRLLRRAQAPSIYRGAAAHKGCPRASVRRI